MLSLIVALASPKPPEGEYPFALSRDAAPGLQLRDEGSGADDALVEHGSALLALLPRAAEVVVVVPPHMLSWHEIVLPRVNSARMRSALEGLLEERLLDDPQTLHFALAPGAAGGSRVWVAACQRAWLYTALQAFETAGHRVARVVPAYAPLPAGSTPILHVVGNSDSAWLVRCADDGVQTLPLGPAALTALNLDTASGLPTAEPAVAGLAEEVLGSRVRVQHTAQGLVDASRSLWDLAQFELTSTTGTRTARRAAQVWAQWSGSAALRPARWGLAMLLLIQLIGINAWAWKERSALQAKRAEVRSLLTQTFPKTALVVNAPRQMEREVAALRLATGAVSSRDLEPMLAAVAQNLPMTRKVSAVGFAANVLTLKGLQLSPTEANALTQGLAATGYGSLADGDGWTIKPDAKAGTSGGTQP